MASKSPGSLSTWSQIYNETIEVLKYIKSSLSAIPTGVFTIKRTKLFVVVEDAELQFWRNVIPCFPFPCSAYKTGKDALEEARSTLLKRETDIGIIILVKRNYSADRHDKMTSLDSWESIKLIALENRSEFVSGGNGCPDTFRNRHLILVGEKQDLVEMGMLATNQTHVEKSVSMVTGTTYEALKPLGDWRLLETNSSCFPKDVSLIDWYRNLHTQNKTPDPLLDESPVVRQPDYEWLIQVDVKPPRGHSASNVFLFGANLSTSLVRLGRDTYIGVDVFLAFAFHRLIRLYGQSQETAVVTRGNDLFFTTVLSHDEIEKGTIIDAVQHLQRQKLRSALKVYFEDSYQLIATNDWDHTTFSFEKEPQMEIGQFSGIYCEAFGVEEFGVRLWSDIVSAHALNQMLSTFERMIEYIVGNRGRMVAQIAYLSETEFIEMEKWNETTKVFPNVTKTLPAIFSEIAHRYPERIAIVSENCKLTYAELDERSDALASWLLQLPPEVTGPEKVIALFLDKSEFTLISILAVFKVGSTYVPLDPTYPIAKVTSVLSDTSAQCVILNRKHAHIPPFATLHKVEVERIPVARAYPIPPSPSTPECLAYVIFTSGTSEGKSRGVLTTHSNVNNYICDMSLKNFGSEPQNSGEVILQMSNYVFDVSVDQMWLALANGLTCLIPPQNLWHDPESFYEFLRAHGVTHVSGTPSFLKQFNWDRIPTLRRLIVGGERLSSEAYKRLRGGSGRYELISMFGPTETTVIAAHFPLTTFTSCVGGPMANTLFYVLDIGMTPVPVGVVGELYIGGAGVARGYLNRPELTATSFVGNPFGVGRLYKTGDLVRRMEGGQIGFIGRKDRQVKIRGNRVEPREVEQALLSFPLVEEAVVLAQDNAEGQFLVAYYVSPLPLVDEKILQHLRRNLVEYMIPVILRIDSIPLTITGKLDRHRLPEPHQLRSDTNVVDSEIISKQEGRMLRIWSECLVTTPEVGIDTNFFEVGGNSLTALEIVGKLREVEGLRSTIGQIFEFPTIRRLCAQINWEVVPEQEDVPADLDLTLEALAKIQSQGPVDGMYLANSLQEGFIYRHLHFPGDGTYVVQNLWQYHELIHVERLKQAWVRVLQKYPSLRLRFAWDSSLFQIIDASVDLDWRYFPNPPSTPEALLDRDRREGYDLSRSPLFRVYLIREGEELFSCLFSNHHAIIDGMSTALLLADLHDIYYRGTGQLSPADQVDTAYALTQEYIQSRREEGLHWWKSYIAGHSSQNVLVGLLKSEHRNLCLTDYRDMQSPQKMSLVLDSDVLGSLRSFAVIHGFTLQSIIQYAWHKCLAVYGSSEVTVTGLTVSGRSAPIDRIGCSVGPYVNTLPLCVHHRLGADTVALIRMVQGTVQKMVMREHVPLASLSSGDERLFDNIFVYENYGCGLPQGTAVFEQVDYPLVLLIKDGQPEVKVQLTYDSGIFETRKVRQFLGTMTEVLRGIPLGRSNLVTECEAADIRSALRGPEMAFDPTLKLHDLFDLRVRRSQDAVALVTQSGHVTFRTLDEMATCISLAIRAACPANPIVPTFFENVDLLPAAILGIFKSGAGYSPIDPQLPSDRIKLILSDICGFQSWGRCVVLTLAKFRPQLGLIVGEAGLGGAVHIIELDAPAQKVEAQDVSEVVKPSLRQSLMSGELAAVIYTSGTTETPKGVMLTHRGLLNFCLDLTRSQFTSDGDVVLSLLGWAFDGIWCALGPGIFGNAATAVLCPQGILDAQSVVDFMIAKGVTHIVGNPLHLTHLELHRVGSLKTILSAGSAMTESDATKLLSVGKRLLNGYGPTETSVISLMGEVKRSEEVNIGTPLANLEMFVLDKDLAEVPPGTVGELYIGGIGLSSGYLNLPPENTEGFIKNLLRGTDDLLHKTCDLVSLRQDGNLEYHGRRDRQVKVRGYRVNCSEVESVLATFSEIRWAVATIGDEGKLTAYIVTTGQVEMRELQVFLESKLPDYMIPSVIIPVVGIPLNSNGKVDYKKLRSMVGITEMGSLRNEAPASSLEAQVQQIWAKVLRIPQKKVGVEENFFRLGGDSISAIQIVSRLRQELGLELRVGDIFKLKSIRGLVKVTHLNGLPTRNRRIGAEQGRLTGQVPFLPIQEWFLSHFAPASRWDFPNHFNQAVLLRVPPLDINLIQKCVNSLNEFHDALRLRIKLENGGYVQYYDENAFAPEVLSLQHVAICDRPEILNEIQSGSDVVNGPVWSVAYIEGDQNVACRLHLSAHHLVVDAVSWRILVGHMHKLYQGQEIGDKGTSFRQWSKSLSSHYQSGNVAKEEVYWNGIVATLASIQCSFSFCPKTFSSIVISISKGCTYSLLNLAPKAYTPDVQEVLLTALGYALKEISGNASNWVTLEGHGREDTLVEGTDLTQTTGWFTTLFPFMLNVGKTIDATIVETKERLRAVPAKGIGYGLLIGYSDPPLPPITFNYLGVLDTGCTAWDFTNEFCGETTSGVSVELGRHLAVDVSIIGEKMQVELSGALSECPLTSFGASFHKWVCTVADFLESRYVLRGSYLTPSDVHNVVSAEVLDKIQGEREVEAVFRANSLQEGFIAHSLSHFTPPLVYHVQHVWNYDARVNLDAFRRAWSKVHDIFPSLRIRFSRESSQLVQIVDRCQALNFKVIDLLALSAEECQNSVEATLLADSLDGFKLDRGPLFRIVAIKLPADAVTIIFTHHHAILDGWSLNLLYSRLHDIYLALETRGDLSNICDRDIAYLNTQLFLQVNASVHHSWWTAYLGQIEEKVKLSGLLRRSGQGKASSGGGAVKANLSLQPDLVARLKFAAASTEVTLNVIFLYTWQKVLSIFGSSTQTVTGVTVSGRDLPMDEIGSSVGCFINTLPILCKHAQHSTIADALQALHGTLLEVNSRSSVWLRELGRLAPEGMGEPLFESIFVYENYPQMSPLGAAPRMSSLRTFETQEYPLAVLVEEEGGDDNFRCSVTYNADLYDARQMLRLLAAMECILACIASDPNMVLKDLCYVNGAEMALVASWNSTQQEFPDNLLIQELLAEKVVETPSAISVVHEGGRLTFAQVWNRIRILGAHLRRVANFDAEEGLLVPFFLSEPTLLIETIFGILVAGGAYVPLDHALTPARMTAVLSQVKPKVILTVSQHMPLLTSVTADLNFAPTLVNLDTEVDWGRDTTVDGAAVRRSSLDPAYIVFTSGSTGEPKGVEIPHRGLVNTVLQMGSYMGQPGRGDVVVPLFGWGFDAVWSAIAVGLLSGGTTVLPNPPTILDPLRLIDFCKVNRVTQVHGNPLLVRQLPLEQIPSLNTVCVTGDAVMRSFVSQFRAKLPGVTLINGYGPTETTVGCLLEKVVEDEAEVCIGRCIGNMYAYVVDQFGVRVPIGVTGELVIGGVGVGLGYHGDPAGTREVFVLNPYGDGRVFKSGDLVRWTDQGKLVYEGRRDFQMKIRGYRVHLSEIEAAVESLPGISKCVVLRQQGSDGGKLRLIAYIVATDDSKCPSKCIIFSGLESILPQYMIPSGIHFLSKLPLNSNGKLDRAKLPVVETGDAEERLAPRNPLEALLCTIWAEVLGCDIGKIGIGDNFYQLGGDSVTSIQIVGRIRAELGASFPVTVRDVLSPKTIASLVDFVPYAPPSNPDSQNFTTKQESFQNGRWSCAANSLQEGLVYHHKMRGREMDAYLVQKVISYGVQLNLNKMREAWERAHALYPGIRVRFDWTEGHILQSVDEVSPSIHWREVTPADELVFEDFLLSDRLEGFDLQKDQLIRISWCKMSYGFYRAVLTVHHAVCDGWSVGILLANVHSTYLAVLNSVPLPPVEVDSAYLQAQRHLETAQNDDFPFWENELRHVASKPDWSSLTFPNISESPLDTAMHHVRTDAVNLKPETVQQIRHLTAECGVTSNAFFQLAWHRVLRIFGHTEETVVGTTVSGRDLHIEGIQSSVGLFMNTLPLILDHAELDKCTGADGLKIVHDKLIALQSESHVKISTLRDVSFHSIFAFENYPIPAESSAMEETLKVEYSEGISFQDYPLLLTVALKNNSCQVELQSSLTFDPSATSRLLSSYVTYIENMLDGIELPITSYAYLGQEEIREIIDANSLKLPTYERTILEYFNDHVVSRPEHIAVVHNSTRLTYTELDTFSDLVCQNILASCPRGAAQSKLVPIFLDRCRWTHVGILGILKTGSAYVPIDPEFPIARVRNILQDISATLVVTSARHAHLFPTLKTIEVDTICGHKHQPPPIVDSHRRATAIIVLPTDLVYAIYTSGTSTGKPKGCLIEHRNLLNYLEDSSCRLFGPNVSDRSRRNDVLLQLASTTFDPSVDQIFLALYNGYTSVVPDAQLWMDPKAFVSYCTTSSVTNIFGTPSMLKLLNLQAIPTLRSVRVAGEKLSLDAYNRIKCQGSYEVANVCGPTETTVVCSYKRMSEFTYSVGRPISNVSFYVVDTSGRQFVPVGTIGELYIGGAGVGRGYVYKPQLTAKHFLPNRWGGEGNVYCSGDLVRRLRSGEVEFIGRRDGQVKVRGYRVELGEVETRLLQHPALTQAAVVATVHTGTSGLVAYYVSTSEIESAGLVDQLTLTLPDYMIPWVFVRLERIPLTRNGKLDIAALPPPHVDQGSTLSQPWSEEEVLVIETFADILGLESSNIGRTDNFFSLGGDSITALLVAEKLVQKLNIAPGQLTVREVLSLKTVSGLAGLSIKIRGRPEMISENQLCYAQTKVATWAQFYEDGTVEWVGRANSLQEGFLAHFLRREKEDDGYAIQVVWKYDCALDVKALKAAWCRAFSKFPGLRVRFDWSTPDYLQIVPKAEFCGFDYRWRDWSGATVHEQEEQLETLRLADRREYFDLASGNLLRVYLIKCGHSSYFCLTSNHHSVLDGWSSSILFSTVHETYVQLADQADPLSGTDVDLAYFRAQELIDTQSSADTEYWKGVLLQVEDVVDFQSLTPLPAHSLDLFHRTPTVVNFGNITAPLSAVSEKWGLTANTLLHFAWHRVLRVFLRMGQTVVGTTVSGRSISTPGIGTSVGLYINTLPMVVDHPRLDEMRLVEALEIVQAGILDLNSKCAAKIRRLHSPHSPNVRPFDSLFIFENFPYAEMCSWEKRFSVTRIDVYEKLDFPLVVTVRPSADSVQATLLSSNSFEPHAISSLLSSFEFVLEWILDKLASDGGATVLCSLIPYCSPPYVKINETACSCCLTSPRNVKTLHGRFKAVVASQRDKVALICANGVLTYGQLDLLSDSLARRILKIGGHGVGHDKLIALLLEKCEWTIIGILAVLKTGSAYVPLDPQTPAHRTREILQDCQPLILVTSRTFSATLEICVNLTAIFVEDEVGEVELSDVVLPDGSADLRNDLAYVIYTSGTGGERPKGCMIEHHSVLNLIDALSRKYFTEDIHKDAAPDEVILQLSSYVYDLSVLQIWLALLNGHSILLPPAELIVNPASMVEFMTQHHATHVSGTPSYLKLINWGSVKSLRRLVVGGELFTRDAWEVICPCDGSFRLINEYGPTETTVTSSFLEMTTYTVGIGWPIDNTYFYVMDERMRILPDGAIGELCIGGCSLARGYLNRPELNREKFVADPFRAGQKLFRTGDLTRHLPDGSFQVIGRNDTQVKIRGQRVELGDVRHWLKEFWGVTDAVVVTRAVGFLGSGDVTLVAYFVACAELSKTELRNWLVEKLPSCAIPSHFIQLEEIPLGATGKVDKRALPNPQISAEIGQTFPKTATERKVAGIWSQILNLDASEIGIDETFYSAGGDSLLFLQMLQKIYEVTGVVVKVADVYHEKTIRQLARAIEKASCRSNAKATSEASRPSFKLSEHPNFVLYEKIEGVGERIFLFPPGLGGVSSYMGNLVPLLSPRTLVLFNNFYEFLKSRHGIRIPYELVAREYLVEIKNLQGIGPYNFVGWSWGGVLALEIARQMAEEGSVVGNVYIVDSLFCIKEALDESDAERLRREGDVSYYYNPRMNTGLFNIKWVLFKATQVENVGGAKSEDDALDERIYSYYVHKTKANHLEALLPPGTSLQVVPLESTHFNWFTNEKSVGIVAKTIMNLNY